MPEIRPRGDYVTQITTAEVEAGQHQDANGGNAPGARGVRLTGLRGRGAQLPLA